jgi:bifunctional DNA-binding transcriptional regulator/antitoxin component of YhaV-PrlF toxin-antitoxin module
MAFMRAFSKVDKDGSIKLPGNIQRAAELKEGQLVELRIVGPSRKKGILITSREIVRYKF